MLFYLLLFFYIIFDINKDWIFYLIFLYNHDKLRFDCHIAAVKTLKYVGLQNYSSFYFKYSFYDFYLFFFYKYLYFNIKNIVYLKSCYTKILMTIFGNKKIYIIRWHIYS